MKTEDKTQSCLVLIVGLLLAPVEYVWIGFVLTKLWAWFIIPIFSLPTLTIGYAIGLAIVAGYLTKQDVDCQESKHEPLEKLITGLVLTILRPAFALLIGWIVLKAQGR